MMLTANQIEKDWRYAPFAITDGGYSDYTAEFIQKFHDLGVSVVPDIQSSDESPAKWDPMLKLGVDGLQTDHPKALVDFLKMRGVR